MTFGAIFWWSITFAEPEMLVWLVGGQNNEAVILLDHQNAVLLLSASLFKIAVVPHDYCLQYVVLRVV